DEVQGEVADDLRRGSDLDETTEDAVRCGVHRLDRLETVAEAERDGLLTQVGQLATGNLVVVDAPRGSGQPRLEGRVDRTHRFPVGLEVGDRPQIETRVPLRELERRNERGHRDLARRPGER